MKEVCLKVKGEKRTPAEKTRMRSRYPGKTISRRYRELTRKIESMPADQAGGP